MLSSNLPDRWDLLVEKCRRDDILEFLQPSDGNLQRARPQQKWQAEQGKSF
jgi:hypothetical protein